MSQLVEELIGVSDYVEEDMGLRRRSRGENGRKRVGVNPSFEESGWLPKNKVTARKSLAYEGRYQYAWMHRWRSRTLSQ